MISRKTFLMKLALVGFLSGFSARLIAEEKNQESVENTDAANSKLQEEIKKRLGRDLASLKTDKRFLLEAPEIAESGATVPIKISFDGNPDVIEALHVFVDHNPSVHILGMKYFGIEPFLEVKIRFAKTSPVRSVIVLKNGDAFMAVQDVKVTVGGC